MLEKIEATEAYVQALMGDADQALKTLASRSDPESTYRKLCILVDQKRFQDAVDLVRPIPPHERWLDRAVIAQGAVGAIAEASKLLAWAAESASALNNRRFRVAFAEAVWTRVGGDSVEGDALVLSKRLSDEDARSVDAAVRELEPVIRFIESTGRVDTNLEEHAVAYYLLMSRAAGHERDLGPVTTALGKRRPIPLLFARAVYAKVCAAPPDVCARLRVERPGEFEPGLMAALIQAQLGDSKGAFEAAMGLEPLAINPRDKATLLRTLIDLSQFLTPEAEDRALLLAPRLVKEGDPLLTMFRAAKLLRAQKPDDAAPLIEKCRDDSDPLWLQLHSFLLLQRGNEEAAAEALLKASDQWPDPFLLWRVAELNYKVGRHDKAAECLEAMCRLQPKDHVARRRLGLLYAEMGDHSRAIQHLEALVAGKPDSIEGRLVLAQLRALTLGYERSLDLFTAICEEREPPPIEAVIGRSQVLRSLGRVEDAFTALDEARDTFWAQPAFLLAYMSVGFSSDHDDRATEAMHALQVLQSQGLVEEPLLKAVTQDDLLKMAAATREGRERAHREILAGRVPWLIYEDTASITPAVGWSERTQPLPWIPEDPVARASYTIYSTNSYGVRHGGGGDEDLEDDLESSGARKSDAALAAIKAPAAGTEVAIDLSALLTLNALGLLEETADYFGACRFPSSYLAFAFEDSAKILSVQFSQRRAYDQIRSAMDRRTIRVTEEDSAGVHRIDWQTRKDANQSSVRSLVAALHDAGKIADDLAQRLLAQLDEDPDQGQVLAVGSAISVSASVLAFFAQHELLDPVVGAFQVVLTRSGETEVLSFLAYASARDAVASQHSRLWKLVKSDARFLATADPRAVAVKDKGKSRTLSGTMRLIGSFALAEARQIPLLCDDRFLQAGAHRRWRSGETCSGFGSDAVVRALLEGKRIDAARAARGLLSLVRWRYRFLVVPPSLLLELARGHALRPPGDALLDVALYVHDSMRDPGLFSGLEATNPPAAMSLRLYMSWANAIGEFIVEAWYSKAFSRDALRQLTAWSVQEFLPPPPLGLMGLRAQCALSPRMSEYVLETAVFRALRERAVGPGSRAIIEIAQALGMDRDEYLDLVARVLQLSVDAGSEGRRRKAAAAALEPDNADRLLATRIARFMLGRLKSASPKVSSLLSELGVTSRTSPADAEVHSLVLAVLSETPSPDSPGTIEKSAPPGPIVFFRRSSDPSQLETIGVLGFFYASERETRRAAVGYYSRLVARTALLVSPATRAALDGAMSAVAGEGQWHPAVTAAHDRLERDVRFSLAGLRQATWGKDSQLFRSRLSAFLRPAADAVLELDLVPFFVEAEISGLGQQVKATATGEPFATALSEFLATFGHVPFADVGSLASLLDGREDASARFADVLQWAAKHPSPLAGWHACAAAFMRPALVADQYQEEVWRHASEVFAGKSQRWSLFNGAAHHMAKYISCLCPDRKADWIAATANWFGAKLTETPLTDEQVSICHEVLKDLGIEVERAWSMSGWVGDVSRFRHATEFGLRPWSVALGCAITEEVRLLQPGRWLTGEAKDQVHRQLGAMVLRGLCTRPTPSVGRLLLDRSVRAAVSAWAETTGDGPLKELLDAFQPQRWLEGRETLLEMLKGIFELKPADRPVFLSALRVLALTETLPAEPFTEALADKAWLADALKLEPIEFECLCHALLVTWLRSGDTKLIGIFYAAAEAARDEGARGERARAYVVWLSVSALATHCTGPMIRLLQAPIPESIKGDLAYIRALARHEICGTRLSFPVVAGRCRSLALIFRKYCPLPFTNDTAQEETEEEAVGFDSMEGTGAAAEDGDAV